MKKREPIVLDLESSESANIEKIALAIMEARADVMQQGQVDLPFLVRRAQTPDRVVTMPLSREAYVEAEQNQVFPEVVKEILKNEFPAKVAQNQRLIAHVTGELKKDPYWSTQAIELLRTLNGV